MLIASHSMPLENAGWRGRVAGGLYWTGTLSALRHLSRSFEWQSGQQRPALPLRRVKRAKFLILCYHRIGTEGIPFYSTQHPETFEAQMQFLHKNYQIVSLDDVLKGLSAPDKTGQAVAVTFDDGYRDVYRHAFPILEKYRIPATIYLTAGSIESGEATWYDRVFLAVRKIRESQLDLDLDGPCHFPLDSLHSRARAAAQIISFLRRIPDERRRAYCREIEAKVVLPSEELENRMLTWDQVREMHRGGVSFGAHTMTHPVVSQLSQQALDAELRDSKRVIEERLQTPVQDFAYPFGQPADYGLDAPAVVAQCGYRSASTTVWGVNSVGADPYRLRRVQLEEENSTSMFGLRLLQSFLIAQDGELPREEPEGRTVAADSSVSGGRSS